MKRGQGILNEGKMEGRKDGKRGDRVEGGKTRRERRKGQMKNAGRREGMGC